MHPKISDLESRENYNYTNGIFAQRFLDHPNFDYHKKHIKFHVSGLELVFSLFYDDQCDFSKL